MRLAFLQSLKMPEIDLSGLYIYIYVGSTTHTQDSSHHQDDMKHF